MAEQTFNEAEQFLLQHWATTIEVEDSIGEVRANEFALRFRVESYEMTIFPDGRAIVKGTSDEGVARSLYARYVGN